MAEQQRGYVSTDPNFGEPITARGEGGYVSTDPNFGEPVKVQSRTWSDRLGLNEGTDSIIGGFLRGSGAAIVDAAQGAASEIGSRMQQKLDAEHPDTERLPLPAGVSMPRREVPQGMRAETPETTAGTVGTYLPAVAEMAVPVGAGAKAANAAIPRVARAGEKFQEVSAAAKDVAVDTKELGDVALRIYQLSERGGSMPKAVRDLLKRVTDPSKPNMAYPEARDFASNISRLSAQERQRLTPVMHREVAQLSAALNKANAEAAKAAGKGAEYKSAMREYAKAKQLSDALDVVIKKAKQAALPAAGVGGAAYWFGRD